MFLDKLVHQDMDALKKDFPEEGVAFEEVLHHLPTYVVPSDKTSSICPSLWNTLNLYFLNRMNIPLNLGGLNIASKAYHRTLLFEEMGRIGPGISISLPGPGLSMPPVFALGTREQQESYVKDFLTDSEPVWGAFAITEPSCGSDATAIQTRIDKDGDSFLLSGEKCFVTNGARATKLVVFASIAPDKGRFGIRAFVVDRAKAGVSIDRVENMMGLRPSQLTNFSFDRVRLESSDMLGHTGKRGPLIDAFAGAQQAWDYMRPCLAAVINGCCLSALNLAEHSLKTDQSSLTVKQILNLESKISLWRLRLDAARGLCFKAVRKYDEGASCSLEASMAKASSSSLAMEIAHELYDIFHYEACQPGSFWQRFYRDAKAFDILEGTGDMQRMMVAQLYRP
ncbi:acyl-CoA dehydrogenase family protein [Pseudobacteriovorax antillogorgiicola]|uniref:Acyl-CoA dehydrogenase n=1 Tax=Pseudobacteriovorax antillogorgiicola TaxID=1513793 RepID=A0A1Y6BZH1_9BACT|nr:acyl-CoA dehydrogenase family protein [Pseudobacteriovorax antillogorgiicola]TCS51193.1 acyl-CoA dehydrogenase [Pseudobacteriovorax antillogorgiicola]SMF37513.1 acyl-CoA dehydrogenase [Pseudobacteriovorax antillogorgiicola]